MTNQVVPTNSLEILKRVEAGQLTVEEGLQQLQPDPPPTMDEEVYISQPQQPSPKSVGKVLRIKVIEGARTKVSVAVPFALVKWSAKTLKTTLNSIAPTILPLALARLAKEINPEAAESMHENLEEIDVNAICDVIVEGLDQLEGVGQFDFVTVEDGDTKVQIGIE